jgi:hypothetical protein
MENISNAENSHKDVVDRIKRGLSGYVSYLAACEMNSSFSEYVLYEPILRILMARSYDAKCEVECPGFDDPGTGDRKRIDFVATHKDNGTLAMEVKWAKKKKIKVQDDFEKLRRYGDHTPGATCLICVFGRESHISAINLQAEGLSEFGRARVADFGKTKYGCKIYLLQ